MRFLVDECCARVIAAALRAAGHDVTYVPEFADGETDADLARLAQAEGRIIVTEDYDFGEIAVRRGEAPAGVILIACLELPVRERAERVAVVISQRGAALNGCLTVISRERVRSRRL